MQKNLFEYEPLQVLSVNARFLYTFLLTKAKLMEILNCSRRKMSNYFKELNENGDVGLIERVHSGNKQNDTIFVKNFAKPLSDKPPQDIEETPDNFEYFTNYSFSHYS